MSAPQTNIDRQKRRHRPALWGIAAVLAFAGIVFAFNLAFSVDGEGPLNSALGDDAPALKSDPPG